MDDPTATTSEERPARLNDLLSGLFACSDSIATTFYVEGDVTTTDLDGVAESIREAGIDPVVVPATDVGDRLRDRYGDDPSALAVIDGSEIPHAVLAGSRDPETDLEVRGAVSDLPGITSVTTTDCLEPDGGARPDVVALVREDGWIVVADLSSGEQRELHLVGNPDAPPVGQEEGGPQLVDSVDLSPDGEWVYFSTCCEPADGTSFRISVDGGEPELVGKGAHPRVSPDGRFVATGGSAAVYVRRVADIGRRGTTPTFIHARRHREAGQPGFLRHLEALLADW